MPSNHETLPTPKVSPPLDPDFKPASLAWRRFQAETARLESAVSITIGLEASHGRMESFQTRMLPDDHPRAKACHYHLERLVKFLLWSRGGGRIHFYGPPRFQEQLSRHFQETATGRFDAEMMGVKIFERPFEVAHAKSPPESRSSSAPLGRHLEGCRIGFDLGGSDRKAAAVIDGKVVFSEEVRWSPVTQSDPDYHFNGIQDSLKRAASHLPRVDAIGGSAAGVYINNRVQVASLFRAVPLDLFKSRIQPLFMDLKKEWNQIPFEVLNDGEVTALAGSMALDRNALLGVAMGTSMACGYVNRQGQVTPWLNELAFAPVDYRPDAPRDEWSGDLGCGVQYFSQQAVGRLIPASGLEIDRQLDLPDQLVRVQESLGRGDERAAKIYETIGVYLGYALAHYETFYEIDHVMVLGRVTSGAGGEIIIQKAKKVLESEFPELKDRLAFHMPDEKTKRHGQAIAAASLPSLLSNPAKP